MFPRAGVLASWLLLLGPTTASAATDGVPRDTVVGATAEEYPRNMITRKPAAAAAAAVAAGEQSVSRWTVPCSSQYTEPGLDGEAARQHPGCTPAHCHRVVVDGFASRDDVTALLAIARKGFIFSNEAAKHGGPTIMDINSGFVRDQDGLINMYSPAESADGGPHDRAGAAAVRFLPEEYALYKDTINRIRRRIMDEFELEELYFTAPTFITREVGNASHWAPKSMHDEYWHPHVDKNNTAHYDYSGLLYLNDHDDGGGGDYTGGMFAFLDGPRPSQPIPCYDEDLQAMGAPQSCAEFHASGMCGRQISDDAVIADYCPAACGRCVSAYTPPRVVASGDSNATGAAETAAVEEEAAMDFEVADDDSGGGRNAAVAAAAAAATTGAVLGEGQTVHLVEPAAGRLVMFSSGRENVHQVRPVRRGTRYVMSMWFTCNKDRFFPDFLDGEVHTYRYHPGDGEEGAGAAAAAAGGGVKHGQQQKPRKKKHKKKTKKQREAQDEL